MIGADKISEIISKIANGYKPEKIILFGSYATGNPTEDSDLDLFVIKETDLPKPDRTVQVRKICILGMAVAAVGVALVNR